ncbi:Fructose-1,6-bisphosphatase/inositol-1-monophosphatase [uncultured archaeon]|nr:Fructose-1,6-bisphosphatase/inositol-1-monophosphatase [uncultured archaeon]
MEIGTLIDIGNEIRDVIKSFIRENADYGEMVVQRPKDITRKMDMAAENALDKALLDRGMSARVISEELGDRLVGNHPGFMLVFDPIDGSTNATCGIPFFCTSLAYTEKTSIATFGDISMAVICDIQGNTYCSEKGNGAFLNGKKIAGIKPGTRPKPVVSVYSYGVPDVPAGLIELEKSIIVRALGSIALDMCFVADNTLDGIIDTRGLVSGYDIMASALILKEAGGLLTDLKGKPIAGDVKLTGLSIIGTKNKELHDRAVKTINY